MWAFLRWNFKGSLKNAQFYACMVFLLSLSMMAGGCPEPWPGRVMMIGWAIFFIDLIIWAVRLRYDQYQYEKQRIVDRLSSK